MAEGEMSLIRQVLVPIHRDGWRFVAAFAVAALLLFLVWTPLGWLGVVLTLWCVYFFRDPERVTPTGDDLVVSPADGVVQTVAPVVPPPELDLGTDARTRVSIFMSVFNVHVNRTPTAGRISRRTYVPGRFFNASLDKASVHNERMALVVHRDDGRDVGFVQIAGLVARRIRCDVAEGQMVRTGERFGLIRFGSRLDIYLPEGATPLVAVGQTAIAGETVLARLDAPAPAGCGERT